MGQPPDNTIWDVLLFSCLGAELREAANEGYAACP